MVNQEETGDFSKEMPELFPRKTYKNIAIAFFIFFLVISAFLINYGIKIRTDEYCTSESLIDQRTTQTIEYANSLSNNDDYLLQKFFWHPNDWHFSQDYYFCYSGRANTTGSLSVNIVNQEGNVLANDFLNNGSFNDRCVFITNNYGFTNGDYVGISCVNCNASNELFIDQHLLGADQELLDGNDYAVSKGLDYDFIYTKDCKPSFKKMVNAFFAVGGILLFVVIILIGINWLRGVLTKGWGF